MRFAQIASRLNGISIPFGGISWVPPVPDVDVARKVIVFLEARRVLFSTYTEEVPEQCVRSVLEIRDFLTEIIGNGGIASELESAVRLMRRYCVRFLQTVGMTEASVPPDAQHRHLGREPYWRMFDYRFGQALGELRSGIGLQIGIIAANYKLDVEDDLAAMIPEGD